MCKVKPLKRLQLPKETIMEDLQTVPEAEVKKNLRFGHEADVDLATYDDDDDDGDDADDVRTLLAQIASTRLKKFAERFLKGFGSGLGVYTGVKLVAILMRNPFAARCVKIA